MRSLPLAVLLLLPLSINAGDVPDAKAGAARVAGDRRQLTLDELSKFYADEKDRITTAWIDVGKEPWVLGIPDMKDRYYLMPLLDGWTTVFQVPGQRTTGTGAQTYAITAQAGAAPCPPE
jgi:hypothetical protein